MDKDTVFDFLIAGGGTAGCVVASRLSHAGFSVAVFEAGPQDYSEKVMSPLAAPTLLGSPLEYNYLSLEQPHLAHRRVPNYGGRLLSGSSGVNYANWTKCHSADYDAWARLVGDERWSFQGLAESFEKVDQVMHASAVQRNYPLREPLRSALLETGVPFNECANGGDPLGFAPLTENWKDGQRQPASQAYDLDKVQIHTESTVRKIIIDQSTKVAQGLELLDGRTFSATKEVLICCGGVKSPQLLMLSGIGPAKHLVSHDLPVIEDLPVGENLHDHLSGTLYFKLKHPDKGLAIGSPLFPEKAPDFKKGNPIDWIVTLSIPDTSRAVHADDIPVDHAMAAKRRGHVEFFISYAPIAASAFFDHSLAGTHISTPILGLLPTSRGSVTLSSTDANADPIIDPNYLDTEMDREALRTGVRAVLRTMLDTTHGRTIVEEETPPPGQPRLSSSSTDEEIDKRVAAIGRSFYQVAGSSAMGRVVDTQLRVYGVGKLRVVDASILPLPLAGHYQYPIYAIAESAAEMVLGWHGGSLRERVRVDACKAQLSQLEPAETAIGL
ncbi:MAG: hypothetical protein LQ338_008275 [Usnochroma carphineum]|nr:MAG: hypothetical protein LQ338_008275 [Usnochroma carphineum]